RFARESTMGGGSRRRVVAAGAALVCASGVFATTISARAGAAPPAAASGRAHAHTRPACADVVRARARCLAIEVLDVPARPARAAPHGRAHPARKPPPTPRPPTTSSSTTTTTLPPTFACAAHSGYNACDLRSAYAIGTTGGAGQTVAIVDAYDDPNAEADL